MTNPSGGNPPFWSPNTDETQYTYNQLVWGTSIDTNATETHVDQCWLEKASLESSFPQNDSDINGNNLQCHSNTNNSEELIYSGPLSADALDSLSLPTWDSLNDPLSLPDWDNLDNILSIPHQDNPSGSIIPLSSPNYSIGQAFQTTSPELLGTGASWDSFQAAYNHSAAQAYDAYSLVSNTQLPILGNSNWDTTHPQLYMNLPPTGAYLSSVSPAMQSSTASTANSTSSPTQSPITNTSNSTSQSISNSTTPSSDQPTSNTPPPPSAQNQYICKICFKLFSKRFEFNKHTPLHTLPQACPLCPHRTARKRDMTRHIAAKHRDVGSSESKPMDKPICRVEGCGRIFARKDHLLRHLRRKHVGCELRT
ncbi:hypothetical protein EYC80_009515 [Monilinia laxa]|uniref:C2H2-type domain-containing protein n=1 Tax=Monilinia laxa TaxID=61186 RepID=A0A5N6JY24_MONLA|nr:hypothetical protein EYC80_009515 [Monilinia laxa]